MGYEAVPVLKRVHRLDSIRLDGSFFTPEGFFIDTPKVTRTGIFEYHNPDGSIRRELRLPEVVFDRESLATYEAKPVIITHDAQRVDKDNVDDEIVGTILTKGYRDGDDVRVKIVIHDIDAVKQSRLRELSLGYDMVLDETPGEWKGQQYDAIQRDVVVNHLAIVDDARAGEQARLNLDSKDKPKGEQEMPKKKAVKKYLKRRARRLDEDVIEEQEEEKKTGFPPVEDEDEVFEPGAEDDEPTEDEDDNEEDNGEDVSIEERVQTIKDRRDRRDEAGDPDDEDTALKTIAQSDEDVDAMLEIVDELQAKIDLLESEINSSDTPTEDEDDEEKSACDEGEDDDEETTATDEGEEDDEKIAADRLDSVDRLVRERLKLCRLADRLGISGVEDMSPISAKKAIVRDVLPGMRLDGKSKRYVNTAFEFAVDRINARKDTNHQRKQASKRLDSRSTAYTGQTSAQKARERMIQKNMNGGK